MKKLILLFTFSLTSFLVLSQTDIELAEYYYNSGEFEQAKLYYEKIYKHNTSNKVYSKYLNTLIALEEFDDAEKIVKKKIKSSKNKSTARVDMGSLYKKFDRYEEADKQFELAIKELKPGRSNGTRLGNALVKLTEYDYALEAYQKAQKIATDNYAFHYEIANLQGARGNHEGMVESFLDLLEVSPNYIQTVQNSLNRNLNVVNYEERADMLKNKLLERVQSSPEITIYNELLIWLFMQKKNFAAAFIQVKSLDQRLEENGFRMIELGKLAHNNKDYATAKNAYQYLIDKGVSNTYFVSARIEILKVMEQEIIEKPNYSDEDIVQLVLAYEEAIIQLEKKAATAPLMKSLAHVKGFYQLKTDEAIEILYEALELPGLYGVVEAMIKLELGDILLLKNEVWDAALLYAQVELDYKEDIIGHEAKLRNAKIAYYTGDFDWAQAQLDVLKASTSKLISNDAIDLSLLITDNFNMDTTTVPMMQYARAELLTYQNQMDLSILTLDSIIFGFPGHSLTDEVLMQKASIYSKQGDYEKAAELYEEVADIYVLDITADDAIYKLAELNNYIFYDTVKAQELYGRILQEFPGSLYVIDARKKFRKLRGDEIN